jgi:nicotinate-nucleotide adenylyltransferase
MRVGYFGGSFDPPHRGHLAVALAARDAFALDRVLLAPTGRQPLKPEAHSAAFADRLAMVQRLCEGEPQLAASAVDGPRPDGAANYTIDALGRVREQAGRGAQMFVIVGADSFLDLPRWRDPAALLSAAEWIVVSRPGFSAAELRAVPLPTHDAGRVHLLQGVKVPVSATDVRSRLLAGESCDDMLTAAVRAYIQTHHLYGT